MWDDGLRIPGDEQQNEGVGAHFRWFYAQFSTPEWLIAARVRTRPSNVCLFGRVGFLSFTCLLPTAYGWQRRWMLAVVDHPNYTPGVMILVLVNMIALCIATADMVRIPYLDISRARSGLYFMWFRNLTSFRLLTNALAPLPLPSRAMLKASESIW
jgi:hypothetical protein